MLENGKVFTIIANGNSAQNVYIKSALLNGKSYDKNYINYADINNGGVLEFEMSNIPNKQRGITEEDKPFSLSAIHAN